LLEEPEDIQLNRVGTLKSDLMLYLNGLLADKEKEYENYEIAGCLDMFKLIVQSQKAPETTDEEAVEVDKRVFIKSLIEAKKAKEQEEVEGSATDTPSETIETKESNAESDKTKE
ncbi:hypothetical protein KKB18_06050, partial [bacterium]|nr:hypothetical protein [bacterium]